MGVLKYQGTVYCRGVDVLENMLPPPSLGEYQPMSLEHSWALSPVSAKSHIRLTPVSDHSDIGMKWSQSDNISNIRLSFLAISDIFVRIVLVVHGTCLLFEYRIHDIS
jgi:hypothetical protein